MMTAQQHKLKLRKSSALPQSLIKQVRKRSVYEGLRRESSDTHQEFGHLATLLQQSSIITPFSTAAGDRPSPHSNSLSPTHSQPRKLSLIERMAVSTTKPSPRLFPLSLPQK